MLLFASPLSRPLYENETPGEPPERLVRLVAGGVQRPSVAALPVAVSLPIGGQIAVRAA